MRTLSFVLLFHALLQPSTPSDTPFPWNSGRLLSHATLLPPAAPTGRLLSHATLLPPAAPPPPVNAADITWRLADDANQDCNAVCNSISKRCWADLLGDPTRWDSGFSNLLVGAESANPPVTCNSFTMFSTPVGPIVRQDCSLYETGNCENQCGQSTAAMTCDGLPPAWHSQGAPQGYNRTALRLCPCLEHFSPKPPPSPVHPPFPLAPDFAMVIGDREDLQPLGFFCFQIDYQTPNILYSTAINGKNCTDFYSSRNGLRLCRWMNPSYCEGLADPQSHQC